MRWTIFVCPDCGSTNVHTAKCTMFPGEPVVHGNRVEVIRSSDAVDALAEIVDDLGDIGPNTPAGVVHALQVATMALDAFGGSSDGV